MKEAVKELFARYKSLCTFVDPISSKDLQEELFKQGFSWATGETDVLYQYCPLLLFYEREGKYYIWYVPEDDVKLCLKNIKEIDINFLLSIIKT